PSQKLEVTPGSISSDDAKWVASVLSVRSDADAQAAGAEFREKYRELVDKTPPGVRRGDLGGDGIWYRVVCGPFGSKAAALELCAALKAAHYEGNCWVTQK